MDRLPFLNRSNYDEIVKEIDYSDREGILRVSKDMIDCAPFSSNVFSRFLAESAGRDEVLKEKIATLVTEKTADTYVNLSRGIYASCLGAKSNIYSIVPVSRMLHDVSVRTEGMDEFGNNVECFLAFSILRELSFDKKLVLSELYEIDPSSVIDAIIRDQSMFNTSILIQMCRYPRFLRILGRRIDRFVKKKEILSMVFVNFYSDRSVHPSEEEREMLRDLLEPHISHLIKVADIHHVNRLMGTRYSIPRLPTISCREFMNMKFSSKADFFEKFLKVSSPSVTHFLSYMEMMKDHFVLDSDEQEMFLRMLRQFHRDNRSYLDIVTGKMIKFGVIEYEPDR